MVTSRLVRLDDVLKAARHATAFDGLFSFEVFRAALVALPEVRGPYWQTDDICQAGHQKDPGYPCPECAKLP